MGVVFDRNLNLKCFSREDDQYWKYDTYKLYEKETYKYAGYDEHIKRMWELALEGKLENNICQAVSGGGKIIYGPNETVSCKCRFPNVVGQKCDILYWDNDLYPDYPTRQYNNIWEILSGYQIVVPVRNGIPKKYHFNEFEKVKNVAFVENLIHHNPGYYQTYHRDTLELLLNDLIMYKTGKRVYCQAKLTNPYNYYWVYKPQDLIDLLLKLEFVQICPKPNQLHLLINEEGNYYEGLTTKMKDVNGKVPVCVPHYRYSLELGRCEFDECPDVQITNLAETWKGVRCEFQHQSLSNFTVTKRKMQEIYDEALRDGKEDYYRTDFKLVTDDDMTCLNPLRTGFRCEDRKSICKETPDTCNNHGTCYDTIIVLQNTTQHNWPSFYCKCSDLYDGRRCEKKKAPCNRVEGQKCLGVCTNHGNSYTCTCQWPRHGINCEKSYNICHNSFCLTGSCNYNGGKQVECGCPVGFTGKYCEKFMNNCDEVKYCSNGGICRKDLKNGTLYCECPEHYTGPQCKRDRFPGWSQEPMDLCKVYNPCRNGKCVEKIRSHKRFDYTCHCHEGYKGIHCTDIIDECDTTGCQNGGECVMLHMSITRTNERLMPHCMCPRGFEGDKCEKKIDVNFESQECKNNGILVKDNGTVFCECVGRFEGRFCQNEIIANHYYCSDKLCTGIGTHKCVDILNFDEKEPNELLKMKRFYNEELGEYYDFVCLCNGDSYGTLCEKTYKNVTEEEESERTVQDRKESFHQRNLWQNFGEVLMTYLNDCEKKNYCSGNGKCRLRSELLGNDETPFRWLDTVTVSDLSTYVRNHSLDKIVSCECEKPWIGEKCQTNLAYDVAMVQEKIFNSKLNEENKKRYRKLVLNQTCSYHWIQVLLYLSCVLSIIITFLLNVAVTHQVLKCNRMNKSFII
ncbi:hypothetical protein SNEBB_004042 [Seison nebaliae]|nr:hypothetical protein SNEBB_004042 [Seison nebaliae]